MMYDLTQAYDRVQWGLLAWAMKRMQIPSHFVRMIMSLLTNTTTKIQTAHGLSEEAAEIHSGIPQGDPIAPILFNIVLDALFDLLRDHTDGWHFSATREDNTTEDECIWAEAYADDITTVSQSNSELQAMHEIVVAYVQFVLNIPLNYAKSVFLAGMTVPEGKSQDPPPENQSQDSNSKRAKVNEPAPKRTTPAATMTLHPNQPAISPTPASQSTRYLGIPFRSDLSMQAAEGQIKSIIVNFCRTARSIPIDRPWSQQTLRLYLFEHVYSRIEHICSVFPIRDAVLKDLDSQIAGLVSHMAAQAQLR